jgi:hypothetical protein
LFFPDTYYSGKDALVKFKDKLLGKEQTLPINNPLPVSNTTSSGDKLSDFLKNNNVTDEADIDADESDPCTWSNQAYPRNGALCTDTFSNPDVVCLENYPANYAGIIDLVNEDSYPLLRCCEPTGMCSWR